MFEKKFNYSIADLQLEIVAPQGCDLAYVLPNFEPFREDKLLNGEISCHVQLTTVDLEFNINNAKLLSDISIVWGDRFTFYETEDHYWTLIQYGKDGSKFWKMRSSKDFTINTIYCGILEKIRNNFLSWYCMVAFAQSSLLYKCVLFHASVVVNKDYGYAFLGKSGTGKSTHSRLWLKYIDGFSLLNDDNPAVRIINNNVFVFGTPWSGKTKCYISDVRPLRGLIRLKQAPENIFETKKNKEALIALLPSCSAIRWNTNLYSNLINILIEIIGLVPVAELQCLPDENAALVCSSQIKKL